MAQAWAGRRPLVLNSPLALVALNALPGEFDRTSAAEAWAEAGIAPADCNHLWSAFAEAGLFAETAGGEPDWWDRYGWREARAYHRATRDYPFLDMAVPGALGTDAARMVRYREQGDGPPPYLHVEAEEMVELRRLEEGESPDERLAGLSEDERHGWEGLSLLLDVCFGERGRLESVAGPCVLNSIPSGGARHPTEVFVAVFDHPAAPAGVYHYDVEQHGLARIYSGQHRAAFAAATFDLFDRTAIPPALALLFTSRVARAMWRYRDPRSFRAVLVDLGHAVMALRMVARKLGLRCHALHEVKDGALAELLRVDPAEQPPLYAATLMP